MKKYKKICTVVILAATMLTVVTGCKKFLDRKPLTATLDDLGGTTESQSLGLYNTLTNYAGFSTLPWLDFNSIRDDDAQKGSSTTDGAEINAEFETYQYTKDDWATNTYWNDHYYMINQTNKEIYYGDSLKLTDDASLRNIGEAHFLLYLVAIPGVHPTKRLLRMPRMRCRVISKRSWVMGTTSLSRKTVRGRFRSG